MKKSMTTVSSLLVAGLTVALLASCTTPPVSPPEAPPTTSTTPTAPPPSPPVTELTAGGTPGNSVVLGELSSQRGMAQLGPFDPPPNWLAVSVRCYGTGSLHIEIPGIAWFNQPCVLDPADPGALNTYNMSFTDEVTVRGSSDTSNLWAMAVSEPA